MGNQRQLYFDHLVKMYTEVLQKHIRGPEDKPWKENKYRVLADMLQKGSKL